VREVDEELGAQVPELHCLGVVEYLFHRDGSPGHEIVYLYSGRLDPEPALEGATLLETDSAVVPVGWRPVGGRPGGAPVVLGCRQRLALGCTMPASRSALVESG
jgi:hypothetical protein